MKDLIQQVRIAIDNRLYFLALYVILTLPDILGALVSKDGIKSKKRYVWWFNEYVYDQVSSTDGDSLFTGEVCYQLRCSLIHEGTMNLNNLKEKDNPEGYTRVIFSEPGLMRVHCMKHSLIDSELVLQLDVDIFCEQVLKGLEEFLLEYGETELFKKNYDSFIRRYPNGIHPYIVGVPVIG